MRWFRKLYTGEQAHAHRFRIISSVKHGKYYKDVFLITLCEDSENLLQFYPGHIYLQPYFMDKDELIVGIAVGKGEALDLVKKIIDDVLSSQGTIGVDAVRQFFEKGK